MIRVIAEDRDRTRPAPGPTRSCTSSADASDEEKTTLKISISGARGIVGDSLTPQLAAALAQAFGTYVGGGPSWSAATPAAPGAMLCEAVFAGLLAVGLPARRGRASAPSPPSSS